MPSVIWTNPQREQAFQPWFARICSQHALDPNSLRPASADASFRRYLRVTRLDGCGDLIVMDSPPDLERNDAFVRVQTLMSQAGLRVPAVLAHDEAFGFMLLSDLGAKTLLQALPMPAPDLHRHLMGALDALTQWQTATQPGALPAYDATVMLRELALFPEWYVAQHHQHTLSATERTMLDQVFHLLASRCTAGPQVFVHRDFMARNLLLSDDGQLGVVDFQDALIGPVTYDIASLLRDAFHEWDDELLMDLAIRYWDRVRRQDWFQFEDWGQDFGSFFKAIEWMGLQRHLKILGIFARLTLRDHKPQYLADAPRFVTYVHNTCARYREFKPLLRFIDGLEGLDAATGFAYGRT